MSSLVVNGFSVDWPEADVARLLERMDRAQRACAMSFPQSMRLAFRSILNSVATSTNVSKVLREYTDVGMTKSGEKHIFEVINLSMRAKKKVTKIYARNEEELKLRPAVMIAMRGLAAQTWREAGKRGGFTVTKAEAAGSLSAKSARIMKIVARKWVDYSSNMSGDSPFIKMANRLPYIRQAMVGGANAVDTAVERAGKAMERVIESKIKKEFGLK